MADIKQCRDTLPHVAHQWTTRLAKVNGIPEDTLQYHHCPGRVASVAALDGATNEPAPEYRTSDAGEFAARWNTMSPEHRARVWKHIDEAQDIAHRCFIEDHAALKAQVEHAHLSLNTARSEIQGLLDSLDSHVTHDEIYSQLKTIQEAL